MTSRHGRDARRFDAPFRASGSAAVLLLAATLAGCGSNVGGFEPAYPSSNVGFFAWDSLSIASCRGRLANFGRAASNARVQLWYATAQGETSRVVLVGGIPASNNGYGYASFRAPPQLTGSEPRFPRVGVVSWNGGSNPEEPRKPSLQPATFCWKSPDSLQGKIYNSGGWAYRVSAVLENRAGVLDIVPRLNRIPPKYGEWYFTSVARESLGILLPPKILKITWEDYGGLGDSLVSPPVDTATFRCY